MPKVVRYSEVVEGAGNFPRIKRVPMFRTGDYGSKGRYTEEDLDAMARNYDPSYLEAPVTPDHVEYGPAWGWIDQVYREGDTLFGDWTLHPDAFQKIKEGQYKRRSIEFYRKHELPNGQVGPYVKACSVLGAATPHCKGMPNIQFTDNEDSAVEFVSPGDSGWSVEARETISFNERIIPMGNEKHETPEDQVALTEANAQIAELQAKLQEKETALSESSKSISALTENLKETNATVQKQSELLSKVLQETKQKDALAQFADCISENPDRVSPAEQVFLKAIFNVLAAMPDTEKVAFSAPGSAADAPPADIHPRELVLELIKNKAPVVDLSSKLLSNNSAALSTAKARQPDMANPEEADAWNKKLLSKVDEILAADSTLSYTAAVVKAHEALTA